MSEPEKQLKSALIGAVSTIFNTNVKYVSALWGFIFKQQKYSESATYRDDKRAKVQVFSLSLIFKLWSLPHYRSPSFQQDMIDNLRNVAIPGTGLPLSIFCYSRVTALLFVFFGIPFFCFCGAVNKAMKNSKDLEVFLQLLPEYYVGHLLHPDDWFSFWRLNCRLVSYHSQVTKSEEYKQEDKWTFLTKGKELGVPVSPYFDTPVTMVCKNKNIEGGMGIFFYKNAAHGGDWILQEKLDNSEWLNELLPGNAPLSTMRVITTSSWFIDQVDSPVTAEPVEKSGKIEKKRFEDESDAATEGDGTWLDSESNPDYSDYQHVGSCDADTYKYVRAESGVLRLGRSNATTDHSSVLFDVDLKTGTIKEGMSNAHWYRLGPLEPFNCPWLPQHDGAKRHPDPPCAAITGQTIPDIQKALDVVIGSHFKMLREVPIVGWDVAFTPKGVFLLEVNLSCNFFRGSFNIPRYIEFVDKFWEKLEILEKSQEMEKILNSTK